MSKSGGTKYGDGLGSGNVTNFQARQRNRLQINFVASENVQGVLYFEIGEIEWGYSNGGANKGTGGRMGTDGVNIETRRAYITFNVPETALLFQVGLQGIALPSAVVGSPIIGSLGTDVASAVGIYTINDMLTVGAFWARPYNGTAGVGDYSSEQLDDEMDLVGLFIPVTVDSVLNFTPYTMYASIGSEAYADLDLPYLETNAYGTKISDAQFNNIDTFNAWWVGMSLEVTALDPLVFMADVAWGTLDTDGEYLDRSGWYLAGEVDYKTPWVTPGLLAWWTSGEDDDIYNGSERMPSIDPNFGATTFGTDFSELLNCNIAFGKDLTGTWGLGLLFKDLSIIENLTHQIRLVFYAGTSSTRSMRDYRNGSNGWNPYLNNPSGIMLTTADWAWEVNFDSMYKIYENLYAIVETGMLDIQRQAYPWRKVENRINSGDYDSQVRQLWKNSTAWKFAFGLRYKF